MHMRLLGIKWYQFVSNAEVQWTSGQPLPTSTIQARRLCLFGHIAQMDDNADAMNTLTAFQPEDWKRPPGRPHIT